METNQKGNNPQLIFSGFFSAMCLTIFLLTIPLIALADIGPKPTFHFDFIYPDNNKKVIVSGELLGCKSVDNCDGAVPMQEIGPQHFSCSYDSCDGLAYGRGGYNKLKIKFVDGSVVDSNIFQFSKNMDSRYKVDVLPSGLVVAEYPPTFSSIVNNIPTGAKITFGVYIVCLLLTLFIELIITIIYDKIRKYSQAKLESTVLKANLISFTVFYLVVYFVIAPFYITSIIPFIILELLIMLFEAWFIFKFNKASITWKSSLILSVIINLASLLIGLSINNEAISLFLL